MKKYLAILPSLFPMFAAAAGFDNGSSLSFAPPPSDYSVVFLADIFGVVDGVLHGTGSQIMGNMFAVLNAAVLALGGIIIMYTLLVSTMNTAHEGQMLGQKWSSIWIPVRSTMGLALLIPKASGYCLMQIFVMWVVLQGIGAADKVWDAALSYLNRGGSIVLAQANPTTALLGNNAGAGEVANGAQVMLAGEVCMLGLQNVLQSIQNNLKTTTTCTNTTDPYLKAFCNTPVPNFINSVDFVSLQKNGLYKAKMPSFETSSDPSNIYKELDGICGEITWNPFQVSIGINLSTNESDTVNNSRVTAIQQMYLDLQTVAEVIVNNNPQLSQSTTKTTTQPFIRWATQEFGVPQTPSGTPCVDSDTPNCILWGSVVKGGTPIFNGTEFMGAIQDYNGIMLPALTLNVQRGDTYRARFTRQFISGASSQGWMMAGSYFFNLVSLNSEATSASNAGTLLDSGTGLDGCVPPKLSSLLAAANSFQDTYPKLGATLSSCISSITDALTPVVQVINGYGYSGNNQFSSGAPSLGSTIYSGARKVTDGVLSSTVYGLTNNSTILQLPGQPGNQKLGFANTIKMTIDTTPYQLPYINFGCGGINFGLVSSCLGALMGNIFYNGIIVTVYNTFLLAMMQFFNGTINLFLMVPLAGMMSIFHVGLNIINAPNVDPVVALAKMGTFYINFAGSLYLMMIEASIASAMLPVLGIFIFALIMMTMPVFLAMMSIMLGVGISTAYYVPVLPYLIFTFGAIAWVMAVIEAMVAAPIVALGVTHPEGHDAFGKGEAAIMILMNIFLRPSMMIIGFITGIAMTYVGVWILNAGFDNAIAFVQGGNNGPLGMNNFGVGATGAAGAFQISGAGTVSGGYVGWAGFFAYFFSILIYTTTYLTIVQKAFTLISSLPDKVLRWIGGQAESAGQESAQWADDTKKAVEAGGKDVTAGQAQSQKQMAGKMGELTGQASKAIKDSGGGRASASGGG